MENVLIRLRRPGRRLAGWLAALLTVAAAVSAAAGAAAGATAAGAAAGATAGATAAGAAAGATVAGATAAGATAAGAAAGATAASASAETTSAGPPASVTTAGTAAARTMAAGAAAAGAPKPTAGAAAAPLTMAAGAAAAGAPKPTAGRAPAPALAPVITLAPAAAPAAPASPGALPADIERQVRQLALDGTRALPAAGQPPRVEVLVGALDARLRLAPCERIEPYLNAGSRLWGASRVGLRCVQGASRWNVSVPVTVKVHGRALVAQAALPAGTVLSTADLALAEVDLAEDASTALTDGALAVGRTLQRAAAAGQSLRQSHLKPRQWFAAGDTVRVLANGGGFTVSGEAVALTRGIEGEAARVRTEGGRVLTGMPAAERRIDLPL